LDGGTPAYSLRAAIDKDATFIYELRAVGVREYVNRIWGWDEAFQATRFQERFDPAYDQVVTVSGRDVGAVAIEWRDSEVFLADIELLPEWRGVGLGTAIISAVLDEARRRGLPVALQVLKGNSARRLYERLGFRVVEETQTHYLMRTVDQGPLEGEGH
jgi:GNAT superfamily N-acetyltransferase